MKKSLLIITITVVLLGGILITMRFLSGEDVWLCENGEWIKHGEPSAPKPTEPCGDGVIKNTNIKNDNNGTMEYNWSTMTQGPYRDKISYAVSDNLLNWQDQGTILAEHASVPDSVMKDGEIFLYFVDVSRDGISEQTGILRSTDNGQTWGTKTNAIIQGLGEKVVVDPTPVLLEDGRIRLYYLDFKTASGPEAIGTGRTNRIYSAISQDGINFVQEEGVRFEYEGIFDPTVIQVDNSWFMYVGSADGNKVLLATSADGFDFTYDSIVHTGGAIPDIIYANDTYFLFTGGIDIASSTDGKNFVNLSNHFQSKFNTLTADASVLALDDGTYILFYKTK